MTEANKLYPATISSLFKNCTCPRKSPSKYGGIFLAFNLNPSTVYVCYKNKF